MKSEFFKFFYERFPPRFQPLGDVKNVTVDTRVIALTNKNLQEAVKNKTFRESLATKRKALTKALGRNASPDSIQFCYL